MPDQAIHIRDCADVPSAWSALEHVYLRNSVANHISLKRRLYGTQHTTSNLIHIYINTITSLASQLRSMGVNMGEEEITDALIFNLPTTYDSVATALMTRHGRLSVSDVSAALVEYESQNKPETTSNPDPSALVAKPGARSKAKEKKEESKSPTNGVTCHWCQKPGHYAHDCTVPAPVNLEAAKVATFEHIELF
jgi:gag-polypeptide of LTR copia-type